MSEPGQIAGEISLDPKHLEVPSCAAVRDEEPINAATHGLGCLLAACGTVAIAASTTNVALGSLLTGFVFAVTATATYGFSALSHAATDPREKFRLRAWDQGVIYLMIVATYTPFVWKFIPMSISLPSLGVLWTAAMVGFVSKTFFHYRIGDRFSPVTYVALGWLPAIMLCCYVPWSCLQWIALGGVLYTVGVPFLTLDKRVPYFHTVWHMLVIAASVCHGFAIYRFVLYA